MTSTRTVVFITGASRGIGLAFAQEYAKRENYLVVGSVRNVKDSPSLIAAKCKVVTLDVTSDESCSTLPAQFKALGIDHINLLINNSGILIPQTLHDAELAGNALKQIDTNALGPLRTTLAVLPLLLNSPLSQRKVCNISSRMGSIGDNTSGGYYGYRASKAAENAISVSLARDLLKDSIACVVLHPGMIQTNMTGNRGDMGPQEAAQKMMTLIEKLTLEDGFTFWHRDGQALPW